jgi:hypothetical protein
VLPSNAPSAYKSVGSCNAFHADLNFKFTSHRAFLAATVLFEASLREAENGHPAAVRTVHDVLTINPSAATDGAFFINAANDFLVHETMFSSFFTSAIGSSLLSTYLTEQLPHFGAGKFANVHNQDYDPGHIDVEQLSGHVRPVAQAVGVAAAVAAAGGARYRFDTVEDAASYIAATHGFFEDRLFITHQTKTRNGSTDGAIYLKVSGTSYIPFVLFECTRTANGALRVVMMFDSMNYFIVSMSCLLQKISSRRVLHTAPFSASSSSCIPIRFLVFDTRRRRSCWMCC